MRSTHPLTPLLLATTALLAACGSSPAPTSPLPAATAAPTTAAAQTAATPAAVPAKASGGSQAAGRDTCALVPGADLAAVLGKQVTRQQAQSATRCTYYTDDPMVFVDLEIDRENGSAAWKGVNGGNASIGASPDAVAGLGDQAFFGPRDRLYVLKGNTFLAIEAGFDDQVRDRARKVAQVALSKAA
jgi:hypothetical protein